MPLVTNLRRLSLDDGPGLRTVVFLKGCPLRCEWCHNPENVRPGPEVMVAVDRCIGCGDCTRVCPADALGHGPQPTLNPRRCTLCGSCVDACPAGAIRIAGRGYPVPELITAVLRDEAYYRASGGGVTFSGGEPALFPDYLHAVMSRLTDRGVHLALETAGLFSWPQVASLILPFTDLVLFDLKLWDARTHRRHTGRLNGRILANFTRLCERTSITVAPRVPLVPGITDTSTNLAALEAFTRDHRCLPLQYLPFNPAGLRPPQRR